VAVIYGMRGDRGSRLMVTGYYLRYSGLDADDVASLPSQPLRPEDADIVQADGC
jgi:hypothetical protein